MSIHDNTRAPLRSLPDLHTDAQTLDGVLHAVDSLWADVREITDRDAFAVSCLLRVATEMAERLHHDLDSYEARARAAAESA